MAVWNIGVFMLRQAPDEASATFWERVIHIGIVALPALYYHFVASFLGDTGRRRRTLLLAYGLALAFTVANLGGSRAFMTGVVQTTWGWVPRVGPLYAPFLVYFNAFLVLGIVVLVRAARRMDSSFRRNRARLIVLGTCVSMLGGAVDFVYSLAAPLVARAELLYPIGIPANMLFALMLGTSIVRYRMFDVAVAVKKTALYVALGIALATAFLVIGRVTGSPLWLAVLLGTVSVLFLTPLGRLLDDLFDRATGGRRRGCYETLVRLSRLLGTSLDAPRLTDTLVQGLVRGIPLTHCVLMVREPATAVFTSARVAVAEGEGAPPAPLPLDGALAGWLSQGEGVVVKDEVEVGRRIPREVLDELRGLDAAVIAPLRTDAAITGILLLGEKRSGEVFTAAELEVVGVLANQAATSLENARLFQHAQQAYIELARAQHELIQAQKMEAVGRLAGGIAHDFNNLLTVIISQSELLGMSFDREDPRSRLVETIHRAASRAAALTRQLLAFSRKQVLQPTVLDLNEVVAGIAMLLRRVIGEDIELSTLPGPTVTRVRADRSQIEQVIMNLAVNARDAMPEGGSLTIQTGHARLDGDGAGPDAGVPAGDYALLTVSDTGVGIPTDVQPLIFEPFFTTKELGKGTGLGLATVYGIVRQHGGHIAVDSAPGAGTRFRVYLPTAAEAESPAEAPPASPELGRETVLLVEDEAEVRTVVRRSLESLGYVVMEAPDPEEALRLAETHSGVIDLLLSDVVMPGMNGLQLAAKLRAQRPTVPIVFMSGYSDPAIVRQEIIETAVVIDKPFTRAELSRALRRAFDARREPRASLTGDPPPP
jgi:signal transduction histidine kinase/ActR/RegA family two-component response regulator